MSPSNTASPLLDALRSVQRTTNKEFENIHGYMTSILSPRRSQQTTEMHKLANPSSMKTPKLGIHPTMDVNDLEINRGIHSPTKLPSRRIPDYPPPREMTLTPNTVRSHSIFNNSSTNTTPRHSQSSDDNDQLAQDQEPELEQSDTPKPPGNDKTRLGYSEHVSPLPSPRQPLGYARRPPLSPEPFGRSPSHRRIIDTSPYRQSITSSPGSLRETPPPPLSRPSLYTNPASPSARLHDRLLDESRRLDQLQKDILAIKQQSVILSRSSPAAASRRLPPIPPLPATSPLNRYPSPRRPSSIQLLKRSPSPTSPSSSPHHSPHSPTVTKRHPLLSPSKRPLASVATASSPLRVSSSPNPMKRQRTLPSSVDRTLENTRPMHHPVLGDMSKAKLKSTATIQTPNGSVVRNKIWEEIHGKTSTTPISRTSKSVAAMAQEEDAFWMGTNHAPFHSQENRPSSLTHRLAKTLDQEMNAANLKDRQSLTRKKKAHIEARSFQLQPKAAKRLHQKVFENELASSPQEPKQQIDGDEWTFAGEQYVVREKRR